jgi:uncharacterized protein (TIRG00374 family)
MNSKAKSALTLLVKICIAVGLILFLVKSGHLDLKVVWGLMTWPNVALALVLAGFNILLAAWRWIILLKARGFYIPFAYGYSLYLIGMFFNYALPGSVSGDLVRGYYLVQDYPTRKMDAVLSVLIDRVLGLYSFFILSLLAVAWDFDFVMSHEKIRLVALLCFLIFVGMTVFFLLSFSAKLYRLSGLSFIIGKIEPLHRLMEGFQRFGKNRKVVALSVAVSLLAQVFTMLFFYQLAIVLGETDVTWQAICFAVPMGFVVTAVPIAPAGVGVGQVAFLYLFQTYLNKTTQFGAVSITAYQISTAMWALVGVIFYVRRRKPHELDNLEAKMEAQPT